jgi:iron complex transport system substrate-binding protein
MPSWLLRLVGVLAAGVGLAQAQVVVQDDSGASVRLAKPARRIVSLAPNITETLFAAGAGDRLVGVVEFSDYPVAARRLRRVGSYARLDLEAIVALKPDLVVGWQSGNPAAALDALRRLGLPVYLDEPQGIADVADSLTRFGRLAGTEAVADAAAAAFRSRLADLRGRYAGRPAVPTFYEVWNRPLTTVGGRQVISALIDLCGGRNVFAGLRGLAPSVAEEAVLASDPEVIVASGMDAARPEWLDDWRRWRQLTAVRRDNLFFVPPDLVQRHTPRLLDGAEQLCRHLETARGRRPAGTQ